MRWGWVLILSLVALAPFTFSAALSSENDLRVEFAESMTWLLCQTLLLVSAAALYGRYRVNGEHVIGWWCAILAAFAVSNVPFSVLHTASAGTVDFAAWSGGLSDITTGVTALVLLRLAAQGRRFPTWISPLLAGVMIGIGLDAFRVVQHVWTAGGGTLPRAGSVARDILLLAICLLIVTSVRQFPGLPRHVPRRIILGTVGWIASYGTYRVTLLPADARVALSLLLATAATMVTAFVAVHLLRAALDNQRRLVGLLTARAESAERSVMEDEEILHELRSTVAGINAASRLLLTTEQSMPQQHRARLQGLLEAEMSRLERLLAHPGAAPLALVDLDEVIGPVVFSHGALGVDVSWTPSGLTVPGRADDIAEVVHVLLDNALAHAPGSHVEVTVTPRPGVTELRVRDDGHGIPAHLRPHIFDRGTRHSASHGQGLGLHVAHRLLHDGGATLLLEDTPPGEGTSFVARFPHELNEDDR